MGLVEDAKGAPLSGAVISLFGRGVGASGLVTLSDAAGRFFVPSLPPGPYTLRALRDGHAPAPARRVLILPNQDATFTISMAPVGDSGARDRDGAAVSSARDGDSAARDLEWLVRHKRRSALEERKDAPPAAGTTVAPPASGLLASLLPDLGGSVQLLTRPAGVGDFNDPTEATSWSVVKLNGRIADSGHWSVGGIVAERETATWRVAGEFVFEPGSGHEVEISTGYGTRALRPLGFGGDQARLDRGVGAVSFQDRWQATDRLATTLGGRYSYAGFLERSNHLDRSAGLELRRTDKSRIRLSARSSTFLPGGDVLTVSSVSSMPVVAFAVLSDGLRAERVLHYETGIDQEFGDVTVEAHTFYETTHDQLVNGFAGAERLHALEVSNGNGGSLGTRGLGLKLTRRFGDSVQGQVSYTYGHGWRSEAVAAEPMLAFRQGEFHDVAARVETMIERTDTRVVAFCRVNRLASSELGPDALLNTRFDVQVSQGLPFLGTLTRADWDVLVAVRNLFYEASEGGILDEMAVAHPPKRVLGGISVRF